MIIYIDEINFTKRSLKLREWSTKNSNLTVNQAEVYVGYRSVIAAMTEEEGIGLIWIYDQACKGEDFRDYLKMLRTKHGKNLFRCSWTIFRSTRSHASKNGGQN